MSEPTWSAGDVQLWRGDCLDVMKGMEPSTVDTVLTDPPYGLEFMGKLWDHGVPGVPFWEEMLRVSKPGATLMAFGGSRTHHRLMCAIEDAGWEIRDCIFWTFGSGFPKSHNIGKAIDKLNGRMIEERLKLALHIKETRTKAGYTLRDINDLCNGKLLAEHWESSSPEFVRVPRLKHWRVLKTRLPLSNDYDWLIERIEAEREVVGKHDAPAKSIYGGDELSQDVNLTAPATDAAKL